MKNETVDPVAEAADLRERGAAHLARLRDEAAARRAERARLDAEEDSKLEAAETEFSTALAEKERAVALAHARKQFSVETTQYTEAAREADALAAELIADRDRLAEKYLAALAAERARVAAGEQLKLAHGALDRLEGTAEPRIDHDRLSVLLRDSPWLPVGRLVVDTYGPADPRSMSFRVAW